MRTFVSAVLCASVVVGCTSQPAPRIQTLSIPVATEDRPDMPRIAERVGAILARHEARAFLRQATFEASQVTLTLEGDVPEQAKSDIAASVSGVEPGPPGGPPATPPPMQPAQTPPPTPAPEPIDLARAEAAARRVMSSVVLLSGAARGTGFFVSADGYILTNAHVARSLTAGPPAMAQLHDGRTFPVRVVGYVESLLPDVGVVKIEATGLPAVEVAEAASLRPNDPLVVIGHPGGYGYWLVTGGRVISASKSMERVSETSPLVEYLDLKTEVPSSEGSSGGPFVDMNGKVVGIIAGPLPSEIVEPTPAPLRVLWTWKEFLALRRLGSKGIGIEDAMKYMGEIVAKGGNLP